MVFSNTLEEPLTWANSTIVRVTEPSTCLGDEGGRLGNPEHDRQPHPVPVTAASRARGPFPRLMFPAITGATGAERIGTMPPGYPWTSPST